jgi:hypothetical protein
VDIVNGTGDQGLVDEVAAHLTDVGLTVGTVTAAEPAVSAIALPAHAAWPGEWPAGPLGAVPLLRQEDVAHVTVVLAAADPAALLAALRALPVCR